MEAVYGNAYLVIAATASANGDTSLSFPKISGHEISLTDRESRAHKIYVRESIEKDHQLLAERSVQGRSFHLLLRAWCIQERLLATRVLHFCPKEMILECRSAVISQCSNSNHWKKPAKTNHRILMNKSADGADLFRYWTQAMREYTLALLTYPSDRLVALSSLAKQFSSPKLGRYLAGLWENYLVEGLHWECMNRDDDVPASELQRARPSFAPSWSWTSVPSKISSKRSLSGSATCRVQIKSIVYVPRNAKAPFGNVAKGEITLSAYVLPARILWSRGYLGEVEIGDRECQFVLDEPSHQERERESAQEMFYCLWLQSWTSKEGTTIESTLLLRRIDLINKFFERIGFVEVHEAVGSSENLEAAFSNTGYETVVLL